METTLGQALAWAAQTETGQQTQGFPVEFLWMMLIIGGLFFFLVLRPQRREQAERQQMLDQLAKGDKVVTAGGFHGTVEGINKDKGVVTLTIAPKISVTVNRSSVATVVDKKGKKPAEEAKGKT